VIGALAVRTGIAPSVLWEQAPEDLATMLTVLEEEAEQARAAGYG
jgi:hypothetical protein